MDELTSELGRGDRSCSDQRGDAEQEEVDRRRTAEARCTDLRPPATCETLDGPPAGADLSDAPADL